MANFLKDEMLSSDELFKSFRPLIYISQIKAAMAIKKTARSSIKKLVSGEKKKEN